MILKDLIYFAIVCFLIIGISIQLLMILYIFKSVLSIIFEAMVKICTTLDTRK